MNDNLAKRMENPDDNLSERPATEHAAADKPNLTLLERGQNPGAVLRNAREKMGLSLAEISSRTKINLRNLEAIESGDLGALPPETFAKAFIKSYAKVVNLDHEPIVASFGFEQLAAASAVQRPVRDPQAPAPSTFVRATEGEPSMPSASRRLSGIQFEGSKNRSVIYFAGLGLLVLAAVFYLPALLQQPDLPQATVLPEEKGMPPAALNQEPAASSNEAPQLALSPQLGSAGNESSALSTPEVAQAPAPSAAPTVPVAQAGAPGAPASPAASTGNAVVPPSLPAASVPVVPKPPVAGQSTLKFGFQDQSWVTVRDASNTVLISQLNQPGSNLEVVGQAPFKVIVGNAKSVSMTNNGKPIDLSASVKGEVARLTVQ